MSSEPEPQTSHQAPSPDRHLRVSREQMARLTAARQAVVVAGETGSGKTTRSSR